MGKKCSKFGDYQQIFDMKHRKREPNRSEDDRRRFIAKMAMAIMSASSVITAFAIRELSFVTATTLLVIMIRKQDKQRISDFCIQVSRTHT